MIIVVKDDMGNTLTTMALPPKEFKAGSKGFWGQNKVTDLAGRRYQLQVQAVLIGSKPK